MKLRRPLERLRGEHRKEGDEHSTTALDGFLMMISETAETDELMIYSENYLQYRQDR